MPKCEEGTYQVNGHYFTVKASDLWDKCPHCEDGYHPPDLCDEWRNRSWWQKLVDWWGAEPSDPAWWKSPLPMTPNKKGKW